MNILAHVHVHTQSDTHAHAHTHSDTHHYRGLFVKVEEVINGILLNHKTRAKFSPLH